MFFSLVVLLLLFLSHEVIGAKFTTEYYRNFREFENNSIGLSSSFIAVLGESEALMT